MGAPSNEPPSRKRADGTILTAVSGRVERETIQKMMLDFEKLGGTERWLIDASKASSYAPSAVSEGSAGLKRLREKCGLRLVVAIVTNPLVRMGASVVGMGATVRMEIVANAVDAERALQTV